jgi:hypothetical protein
MESNIQIFVFYLYNQRFILPLPIDELIVQLTKHSLLFQWPNFISIKHQSIALL